MACRWRGWQACRPAVVERAREILGNQLEKRRGQGRRTARRAAGRAYRCFATPHPPRRRRSPRAQPLGGRARLRRPEPDTITAREALDLVYELQRDADGQRLTEQWLEGTGSPDRDIDETVAQGC